MKLPICKVSRPGLTIQSIPYNEMVINIFVGMTIVQYSKRHNDAIVNLIIYSYSLDDRCDTLFEADS